MSLEDVKTAVCDLVSSQPKIVALEPMELRDVWRDIFQVAEALGVPERGRELVAGLRKRLDEIRTKAEPLSKRPRVACLEWIDPLMAAGNWVPELVEIAGGVNLFGKAGEHSPWMTWEELVACQPDVIAIMPCGFDIPRTLSEMIPLTSRAEWARLSAVKAGRVFVTDGNQYFNRPGPRLVESAEILAEIFHPDEFDFGHRGTGWVQLNFLNEKYCFSVPSPLEGGVRVRGILDSRSTSTLHRPPHPAFGHRAPTAGWSPPGEKGQFLSRFKQPNSRRPPGVSRR